jgi:hypothetical protein
MFALECSKLDEMYLILYSRATLRQKLSDAVLRRSGSVFW